MQISTRARSGTIVPTAVTLVSLAAIPFLPLSERWHFVLMIGLIYAIAAVGLDLFSGYCGQLTFGNFGFIAIGAYSSSILSGEYGWTPWATLPAAAFAAGLFGLVLGAATVRLPHLGTAMGTFFFAFVVAVGLRGATLAPWTQGPTGRAVERITVFGDPVTTMGLYWLSWMLLVAVTAVSYRYANSRAGEALRLVKRSETVAEAMGINVSAQKLSAFVWSAMAAGVAGFLYGQAIEYLIPETFHGFESVILLTMAIIGGLGSIAGPIIGAVLFSIAAELTRSAADVRHIIFAVLLLFALIFAPDGFYALIDRARAGLRRRTNDARIDVPAPLAAPAAAEPDSAGPQILLSLEHVQVKFGGITAIEDISLHVRRHAIHAIIGPNGAGKTTFLNCISGLQRYVGRISFDGGQLTGMRARDVRKSGICRTFQNPSLVADLTVEENVELGTYGDAPAAPLADVLPLPATLRRDAAGLSAAHRALDSVGFPHHKRTALASELSLAEQKIVDIARAIAGAPRLLLLDEPTAGLAESEIEAVAEVLKMINAESRVTIIVIAHHIGFVRSVAHHATVLDFGRIIADGQPDEVTRKPEVMDVFLGAEDA